MGDKKCGSRFLCGGMKDRQSVPWNRQGICGCSYFNRQKLSENSLQEKLEDNSGLTLIEMLCATLILILLCVMLSTGLMMAANDYRRLTAEAETELLLNTITNSLTDKLRHCRVSVKTEADGSKTYSCSMGEIKIAEGSSDAGITKPAAGTVIEERSTATLFEQNALLPDGAYGAVVGTDADGKKRRYQVMDIQVIQDPAPGDFVTFTIHLTVKDRTTGISRTTPAEGIVVRCLNPVAEIP